MRRSIESTQYFRSGTRSAWARPGSSRRWEDAGDSYDNALAETVIGFYKSELIYHEGPWCGLDHVELETGWVAWYNTQRLLEPIGYVPPGENDEQFHRTQSELPAAGALT